MVDFSPILSKVPNYERYLSVDELDDNSKKLASEHGDTVKLLKLGKTRNGHEIISLKIGNGKHNALVYGFPNPEEPLGGLVLDYMCEALVENPEILRELDYTWYIIKCIDPDGAKLTQGYLKGPYTPYNFALNYYRTPVFDTGEENFPYRYGDMLDLNKPTPETLALMKIMNGRQFDFISSLHNMAVCGITFQVSQRFSELYAPLQMLAAKNNIPLRRRIGFMLAPGIQLAAYMTPTLNYIRNIINGDTQVQKITGAFVLEYARLANSRVFMMIPESGVWYDKHLYDENSSGFTLREIIEESSIIAKEASTYFVNMYKSIRPLLNETSPFKSMLDDSLITLENPFINVIDPDPLITDRASKRGTSVGQKIETEVQMEIRRMIRIGTMIHALRYEQETGRCSEINKEKTGELLSKLNDCNDLLNSKYMIKHYRMKSLVATNLGSILCACAQLKSSYSFFELSI